MSPGVLSPENSQGIVAPKIFSDSGISAAAELIQDKFSPRSPAAELFRILESSENQKVREKLEGAADKLGHGGASKRAAGAILKLLADARDGRHE